jgi:hypothetical protein
MREPPREAIVIVKILLHKAPGEGNRQLEAANTTIAILSCYVHKARFQ